MDTKKSWADIVKNSNKSQIHPVQYVKSTNEPKCKNNIVNKTLTKNNIDEDHTPMTKENIFNSIWCWGEHQLLFPLINILTIDEINFLIDNIDYKLYEIESWSNPERDYDRKKDLEKCKTILIKQKIKHISLS